MRFLHVIGFMTGAAGLASMPAAAQHTAMPAAPSVAMSAPMMHAPGTTGMRQNWGHRIDGRWSAGHQAPGGWAGYRRPVTGFILPGYWMQPPYYISRYDAFGLPAPTAGYGWSRYYDDAVMTDRYGRVHDSRVGYDWDRYGGLIGSAIAGPGNRTGGAILGAGLGAIAGGVIADSTAPGRTAPRATGAPRYNGAPSYAYDRWASLDDATRLKSEAQQRKAWEKERRRLDKLARAAGYASYEDYVRVRDRRAMAYAPVAHPHWAAKGGPEGATVTGRHSGSMPHIETQTLPGYVANGYYYPGATITTVTIAPSTVSTTTTRYVTTSTTHTVAKPRPKILKRKIVRSCRCE
jgi:Ni/Co efflux regulator RcnB